MIDNNYNQNFFVVPFYIINLPGITFSFIKVYETIFQFWNKGRNCYLSNTTIIERTGVKITQIKEAISFFESIGELKRITKGTKRYLIRPERPIEHDGTENEQVAAPPARGGRSSGQEVAAPPATEINKLNKENKSNTTTSSSNVFEQYKKDELASLDAVTKGFNKQTKEQRFKEESLSDPECNRIFQERFSGLPVSLEYLYDECADYWSQKDQMVYKARFLTHLKKTPLDKYKDIKDIKSKSSITPDENKIIQEYCSSCKATRRPNDLLKQKIALLLDRLKKTDTTSAREAIAAINKAEELFHSSQYSNIIADADSKEQKKRPLSDEARSSLGLLKDILR